MEAIIFISKSKPWGPDWNRTWSTETLPQPPRVRTAEKGKHNDKSFTISPVKSLTLPPEVMSEFEIEDIISKNKARMLEKTISP